MSYMKRLIEDKVYVQVYLNEREDGLNFMYGFQPDDKLRLAAEYYTDASLIQDGQAFTVLNRAFTQLNIDTPTEPWAIEYRRRRNRSLSVGDVVVVGEVAYACESVGWKAVSLSTANVVDSEKEVSRDQA